MSRTPRALARAALALAFLLVSTSGAAGARACPHHEDAPGADAAAAPAENGTHAGHGAHGGHAARGPAADAADPAHADGCSCLADCATSVPAHPHAAGVSRVHAPPAPSARLAPRAARAPAAPRPHAVPFAHAPPAVR